MPFIVATQRQFNTFLTSCNFQLKRAQLENSKKHGYKGMEINRYKKEKKIERMKEQTHEIKKERMKGMGIQLHFYVTKQDVKSFIKLKEGIYRQRSIFLLLHKKRLDSNIEYFIESENLLISST